MTRKEPSAKQERAWAYNQANGKLKGMITQLTYLKSELPLLDEKLKDPLNKTINALWNIRQGIIDHQKKLIKEGK